MFDQKKFPFVNRGHQYALDIISGKIVANIWIIAACKRYLSDLERIKTDPECRIAVSGKGVRTVNSARSRSISSRKSISRLM